MTPAPGLYDSISYREYDAIERLRFSDLKAIGTSPLAYRYRVDVDGAIGGDTPALALGRAVHLAVLEPTAFERECRLFVGVRRGKSWEAFALEHAGRTLLSEAEHAQATAIAAAVRAHAVAAELLADGVAESTAIYATEGVACKARLDWLDAKRGLLVDLKSTRDPSPLSFPRDCVRYDYHAQLAWYADAALAVGVGAIHRVCIIAAQSVAPWDVVVYDVPVPVLELGRRSYRRWLGTYQACVERGEWPGIAPDKAVALELPPWAYDTEEITP